MNANKKFSINLFFFFLFYFFFFFLGGGEGLGVGRSMIRVRLSVKMDLFTILQVLVKTQAKVGYIGIQKLSLRIF